MCCSLAPRVTVRLRFGKEGDPHLRSGDALGAHNPTEPLLLSLAASGCYALPSESPCSAHAHPGPFPCLQDKEQSQIPAWPGEPITSETIREKTHASENEDCANIHQQKTGRMVRTGLEHLQPWGKSITPGQGNVLLQVRPPCWSPRASR